MANIWEQIRAQAGDIDGTRARARMASELERAGTADWRQELGTDKLINPATYGINTQGFMGNTNYMGMAQPTYNLAPQLNTMQSDEVRAQQMALAGMLQGQAAGTAPSMAQAQLQAGTDANIAQQMALAQSAQSNPALAQRLAMQNAGQAQQTMAQQATLARLQEQQMAQQSLAGLLSGTRGQDLTGASANLGAQTSILGQNIGANAQLANTALSSTAAQDRANQQAALAREQMNLAQTQGLNQFNLGAFNTTQGVGQSSQSSSGLWSGLGSVIGGIAGIFSDEDVKKNVKDGSKKLGKFLSNINAHEYEYKDKSMGEGKYISPMAQEIEKSEVGKNMIVETPVGKAVNYQRGLGVILASQGYLNKRLDELEDTLKKRGAKNG